MRLTEEEYDELKSQSERTGLTMSSIICGAWKSLAFCADCGSKLRFHAAKSIARNQEHFCWQNTRQEGAIVQFTISEMLFFSK